MVKKKKKGFYIFNSALKHLTKPHPDIQGHHIYWVIYCTQSNVSHWVLSTVRYVFSAQPRAKNNSPFPEDLLIQAPFEGIRKIQLMETLH